MSFPGTQDESGEVAATTLQHLKKTLVEAGFELFRARGDEIVLAERPRENLIMDSGVRLKLGAPYQVRVVFRTQRSEFPGDDDTTLFARVRELAAHAVRAGFTEIGTEVIADTDPVDRTRVLDTSFEILFTRDAEDLPAAIAGLREALGFEKSTAGRS